MPPPDHPGFADGPSLFQPTPPQPNTAPSSVPIQSTPAQPEASPSGQPRRRQRVDSSSSQGGPASKRTRLSPSPPPRDGAPGTAAVAARTAMSANAFGKLPAVVDLTAPRPSTRLISSHDLQPQLDAEREKLRRESAHTMSKQAATSFQPLAGARKLVIKNLRASSDTRALEVQRYYERTWAEIEDALRAVFASQTPRLPLERIYRGVENLCLHGQADRLYRKLRGLCETHLNTVVLEQILADMRARSNVDALRIVHQQWQVWSQQSTIIRSTFSYLDRSYLANERSLQQINDMLISRFRRMVFEGARKTDASAATTPVGGAAPPRDAPGRQVLAGMCELVDQDRHGDPAFDAHLLREAVSMLHICNVYGRSFEPLFLKESEAYLRDVAQERDASASLQQYIQACETLLRREDTRCNAFNLDSSTKKALLAVAQRLLIFEKAPKLLEPESVARLLDANDVASVKALYELLRLSGLHRDLRAPWEAYIEKVGFSIVTDVARGDEMVVRLLLLRRSLDVMVRDAFGRDEHFVFGLRQAFGQFVNDRRVAAAWAAAASGGGASKVGEMVAKHIDMLLRGGLKTLPPALLADKKDRAVAERSGQASAGDEDAELDRQLDHGLELFRFIEGKDVFEAFYKKDLARRLLMGRSASHDAERNMLSKLKIECGSSLTHNLEQMFRDQELSRDEMAAYKQWLEGGIRTGEDDDNDDNADEAAEHADASRQRRRPKVDLQVSVLSAAAWPTYREVQLNLPAEVVAEVDRFDRYYKNKHTGRQLTWMHALGHCVVKARFAKGVKELLVSSFQAAVLLLFNQVDEHGGSGDGVLSYGQIAAATGLAGGDLDRTLQSLACGKVRVLSKHPRGRDVAATDTFTVNRGFADPKVRIKINQIQLRETREENQATYERVAADRQFETQAAIVRIMKSRKALGHAQLVAEVISQTKSRGAMDPADIKQNIEKLIEKDYLEREDGKYVYLA